MKIKFIMGLVLVLFVSLFVASCNNDDEESLEQEWAHIGQSWSCVLFQ